MPDRPPAGPAALDLETPAPLPSAIHGPQPDASLGEEGVPDEIANVPGVTQDWWAAVQEQIRQDMYAISSDVGRDGIPSYHGYNHAHNFDLTFTADGVQLSPGQPAPDLASDKLLDPLQAAEHQPAGADEEEQWEWGLHFTGYGYEGSVQPVSAPVEMIADGNRIEYRHDGITEWYINDDRGLEQGFTINTPPASAGGGAGGEGLILEMALETDLTSLLSGDAQTIDFTLPDGNVILLRYTDLYVTDVTGKELPASLSLSPFSISIVIDDAGATYPLTVDPLIATPPWTALGENDGDEFGFAVGTAGDVNGDGYADLVVGASGYGALRGKVYVYHGGSTGLTTGPADWTAGGENDDDLFGCAVGTAGDVNGDGYDDLVVGASDYAISRGKVYVYHGGSTGLTAGPADWTAGGENGGDHFGYAVGTAGDVNGDGYADLVVGADYYDSVRGKVYVYHGGSTGLTTRAIASITLSWIGPDVSKPHPSRL